MKKNICIIFISIFFLFVSAETNLFSFKIGNFNQNFSSAELAMIIFILFILFFLFKKYYLIEFYKEFNYLIILILLFLLSGFFSAILSPVDKLFSIKYLFRYLLFTFTALFLIYLTFINKNIKNYYLYILFFIAIVFSFIAILEVFISSFGIFLSNVFRDGQSVYINNKLRPAATLTHSNIFACFMGISVIIAIKLYFEKNLNKFLFFTGITFLLIGLSLSSSRNALFSFLISLLFLFLNKKYFKITGIVLLIFLISYLFFSPKLKRISEIKTESSISRILLHKASFNMFKNYSLFGVGPGCFNKLLSKYASEKLLHIESENIKKEALNAHNGFFNILAEFGLSGVFILSIFAIYYLIRFLKLYPLRTVSINHSLLLVILLPFLPDAFFYSYFYMVIFLIILLTLLQKDL